MRKLIAVGLLLTVAALFLPLQVTLKEARAENPKWVWETVPFRTSCVGCYGGYIDSSFCSAVGVAGTTFNRDTTAWISLGDWAKPPSNAPGPDSLLAVIVVQPPPGQLDAQSDSVYIIGQISDTGSWNDRSQRIEPMNLGGTQGLCDSTAAAILIKAPGSESYRGFLHIGAINTGTVGGTAAVSYTQVLGSPFIRFILRRDAIGPMMIRVGHYTWN